MMSLIISVMLPLTLLCAAILLLHKPLLARLGAHNTYTLWVAVPLLLAGTVLGQLIPARQTNPSLYQLQHFRVQASEFLSQSHYATLNMTLGCIWLLGSLTLLGILLYQAIRLKQVVAQAQGLDLPKALLSFMQLAGSTPKASVGIKCHPQIDSPMLAGLLKPVILVPMDFKQLTQSQQASILDHELRHLARHDIAANLLGYLLVSLFWFNPVCWLAYRRFRDDQEIACDAEVTRHMDKQQRIAYSQTLLAYSQQAHLGMLHTHYGNKTILKERIMQLKKTHTKRPLAILGLALTLGLSGALINQSAVAGDKHQDKHHNEAKAPSPVMRVEPAYPAEAAEKRIEGYVQLQFEIDKQGNVSNVTIIKSYPGNMFDDEAMKALSQWRYESSKTGVTNAKVQLDFMMSAPKAEIERVRVTAG
ncbi:TonB family protein [Shewanella aquimarina]|uniref:M56 family metallopeptidase n=1 Tax=Shewanella aquimarina TaxID=260365 RepID=UPI002014E97F|nr:M56 family metallopeptidase [Shewanella aquimarina]MCL2909182.1 TonB family protein [Shewanella aquimarina]